MGINEELIAALSHPEAEDGLYFENLVTVHEDEERPAVSGDQIEVLNALQRLIEAGTVTVDDSGEKPIFYLANRA